MYFKVPVFLISRQVSCKVLSSLCVFPLQRDPVQYIQIKCGIRKEKYKEKEENRTPTITEPSSTLRYSILLSGAVNDENSIASKIRELFPLQACLHGTLQVAEIQQEAPCQHGRCE